MLNSRIDIASVNKFDGKNYHQWKFQLMCALRAKGIDSIITGTKVKPEAAGPELAAWTKDDAFAMFTLTSAMDYSQITLIENCSSSNEILVKLNSIYQLKSETNKIIVHEKFHQDTMTL